MFDFMNFVVFVIRYIFFDVFVYDFMSVCVVIFFVVMLNAFSGFVLSIFLLYDVLCVFDFVYSDV